MVPFVLLLDFSASLSLGSATRRHANWGEIRTLLPFSFIGVILGVTLLVRLPKEPLLTALGLFVIAFGMHSVLNLHSSKPLSRGWAIPAGLTGGTVGALFGTGGPPYVIYLSHRLRDKSEIRATFTGLFLIDGGLRILTFLAAGLLLHPNLLWAVAGALPLMALGLYLGHKVHVGLSQAQMLRLIGALLLMSGASLLGKSWA